MELKG